MRDKLTVVSSYPVIYAYTTGEGIIHVSFRGTLRKKKDIHVKQNRKNQGDMHNDFGEYAGQDEIND